MQTTKQKAAAITAAADKPVKRAETSSMQVNLFYWLHLGVMYLFLEQILRHLLPSACSNVEIDQESGWSN